MSGQEPSGDAIQLLSPDLSIFAQWAHLQSGHGIKDGGYAELQKQQVLLVTNMGLAALIAECQTCQ